MLCIRAFNVFLQSIHTRPKSILCVNIIAMKSYRSRQCSNPTTIGSKRTATNSNLRQQAQMVDSNQANNQSEWQIVPILKLLLEIIMLQLKVIGSVLYATYRVILPDEPKNVDGEIILITGAGHGMGREMALRFAKLGATIISVDINPSGNEETQRMIRDVGGKCHTYLCDITNKAAVTQLAEKVKKEVGDVTILINNAGIMPCKRLLDHTEKDIRSVVDINVVGILWMIQAFLPPMLDKNRGHIVCMSSMVGLNGSKNVIPYSGTKFAVQGIMKSLDMELESYSFDTSGIKLTTVYPYIVNTGLAKKPNVRFSKLMKLVEPGDAADQIVDAVRRNYFEVTVPSDMYYTTKFFGVFPLTAVKHLHNFISSSLDPHDD